MGCKQSTPEDQFRTLGKTERLPHSLELLPPKEPSSSLSKPLTHDDILKRTTCTEKPTQIKCGDSEKRISFDLKFACRSQRGFYPDNPSKANQDSYGITQKFGGEDGDIMLAVYDGHGDFGHKCAGFAKKKLPGLIAKQLRQKRVQLYQEILKSEGKPVRGSFKPEEWPIIPTEDYERVCANAFVECNTKMHKDIEVDDRLSGTTAIVATFHFGRMTVFNVGDSRAIIGQRIDGSSSEDGNFMAIPLSTDQTSYRRDERERIKSCGGVIMSIDQMEGNEPMHENWGDLQLGEDIDVKGDPPRVWVKGRPFPGCAFTRSFGDRLADEIGVNAEPEMLTVDLTEKDRILVIASDGIFEFLTNQAVIDICAECEDPVEACEKVVNASYKKWLEFENRTDDITVIVGFLQCTERADDAEITTDDIVMINAAGRRSMVMTEASAEMVGGRKRMAARSMYVLKSEQKFGLES